jgi:uncharacterized protein (TIGR00255 family)
MTGFGQAEAHGYHVEIKGINHRFKDIRVRVPKDMGLIEAAVRDRVNEAVNRGKVEVTVARSAAHGPKDRPSIDLDLARAFHAELCTMAQAFGGEVTFRDVLLMPGVVVEGRQDPEDELPLVTEALSIALERFLGARAREGEHICADIYERTRSLEAFTRSMKDLASGMTGVYKDRLHANLSELLGDRATILDKDRLEQEVALLAERSDVTEEIVRLEGHIRLLEETISHGKGPIGRQVDFILQEINREVNTIGSKSQLAALSRMVIDAKAEMEKIREQAQNIE